MLRVKLPAEKKTQTPNRGQIARFSTAYAQQQKFSRAEGNIALARCFVAPTRLADVQSVVKKIISRRLLLTVLGDYEFSLFPSSGFIDSLLYCNRGMADSEFEQRE